MAQRVASEVTVIGSDMHFPYQDDDAIDIFLDVVKYLKPDRVILNGDVADFYSLSKFNKDPQRALELQEEIDMCVDFLNKLTKIKGDRRVEWVQGNHEQRLERYLVEKAPSLTYLRALQFESLLELDRFGVEYIRANGGRGAYTRAGLVTVGHFDVVRKHSAATAQALVTSRFESVVQSHVHRLGDYYHTTAHGTYIGCESGCLCDTNPEYVDEPDWQQGLVIVRRVKGSERYHITPVPIIGGECFVDGVLF